MTLASNASAERNFSTVTSEYSMYPLLQLLKARYWIDSKADVERGSRLEEEIQRRCAHIREVTNRKISAGRGSRFRPYGLIFGAAFLVASVGPFVAVEFLDAIRLITDVNGDHAGLSGLWALVTLPFAATAFLIGGIMDAERIVKWLNL
jgi:hypothetical protein